MTQKSVELILCGMVVNYQLCHLLERKLLLCWWGIVSAPTWNQNACVYYYQYPSNSATHDRPTHRRPLLDNVADARATATRESGTRCCQRSLSETSSSTTTPIPKWQSHNQHTSVRRAVALKQAYILATSFRVCQNLCWNQGYGPFSQLLHQPPRVFQYGGMIWFL